MKLRPHPLLLPLCLLALAPWAGAQQPAPAPAATAEPAADVPEVGAMAPDFTFRRIDSTGVIAEPVKLSDYRGETVVLWFFIKARTRG